MPSILVTNDDGVLSPGIHALAAALRSLGDVTIVAPVSESSAIGHALTLARPLRLEHVDADGRVFSVDGTPTDCVNIALTMVLDGKPDLVVSGINKGCNLGDDVTYSGTVAGAMEGALLGISGDRRVAGAHPRRLGFHRRRPRRRHRRPRASCPSALPPARFSEHQRPARRQPSGFRATVQAKRNHVTKVTQAHRSAAAGRTTGSRKARTSGTPIRRSDYQAVRDGWISVTPLQPDLTATTRRTDPDRNRYPCRPQLE